jgi:hypothetical protein
LANSRPPVFQHAFPVERADLAVARLAPVTSAVFPVSVRIPDFLLSELLSDDYALTQGDR